MTKAWERRRKRGGLRVAKKPVLVIDEANKLEKWGEKHQEDLDALISFFIMITKRLHRCHVFLVTSECGFEAWLQQQPGMRDIFCSTYVVGHFEEKDAKDFLELELQASLKNSGNKSTVAVSNADWRQIYEVCGGNAGLLKLAAGDFGVQYPNGSWRSVLEELCSATYGQVQDAALQGGDGFNSVHYIDAALALLNSPHNAITQHAMELLLGSRNKTAVHLGTAAQVQAGARVLRAIVKANRLGLRPYSAWAKDIPREAYGPEFRPPLAIVTAPTPADLYSMRVMRSELEALLMDWEQRQQAGELESRGGSAARANGDGGGNISGGDNGKGSGFKALPMRWLRKLGKWLKWQMAGREEVVD
eukprot:TRINITY_DN665_c2_g1_i2.p1 TRINITY_DN665_c2_g1~~TRINITY_DN665_c2_g1_i2.p1  ORF type:complete len:361 (+),score=72.58 TRINITY_DN665_c2_g1_i2:133-1215(+)